MKSSYSFPILWSKNVKISVDLFFSETKLFTFWEISSKINPTFGSYMILKSFDYKIGNNFKIFRQSTNTWRSKCRETNMSYEDVVLAVIIVKTLLVIYYIIVTDNCQWHNIQCISCLCNILTQYLNMPFIIFQALKHSKRVNKMKWTNNIRLKFH